MSYKLFLIRYVFAKAAISMSGTDEEWQMLIDWSEAYDRKYKDPEITTALARQICWLEDYLKR